ncbi:MAG TPA: glycosyltransferase family 39 protein, partial [Gemmatimonadales bacterium]|nr:glycosyltransferase family 39 protein [Gemmatimonadales bacterium]
MSWAPPGDRGARDTFRFVLLMAAVLGVIVRSVPVFSYDFPLNDGGLFAVMSADLRANGFLPPAFTSYNGGDIPFGYPPLGIFLNAFVESLLDVGPDLTLRVLPLSLSILTIPAFYHMIRRWLDPTQTAVALLAWALVPRAWMWGVAGGGITRSLGMLLAFLAVAQIMSYVRTGGRRRGLLAGILSGLTLMAHVEAAAFVAATVILAGLLHHRSRTLIGRGLVIAVVALIVAAPWWATVMLTHGIDPLLAAGQSRSAFYPLALAVLTSFGFTGEPYLAIVAMLGLVGLAVTIASRRLWLAAWIVAIFVALPGGAATYAMVPWSMLVATAVFTLAPLVPSRRYGVAVAMSLIALASSISLLARDGNLGLLTAIAAPQR